MIKPSNPPLSVSLLVTLLLMVSTLCLATDVYKTVDEQGRVIYTDKPTGTNSELVKIPEPIVVPEVIPKPRIEAPKEPAPPTSYNVTMTHPTPEMHINPGTFHLPIQVNTNPSVHPLHRLVVLDNGQPIDGMMIEYIVRGTHTIQAQVLDQRGKVLGSSEVVTVYVHRPTINSRENIKRRESNNDGGNENTN